MRIYPKKYILIFCIILLLSKESFEKYQKNYAILISTSLFWFNYRGQNNVNVHYHALKKLGFRDSEILIFSPEEFTCNPRNNRPGQMTCLKQWKNHDYSMKNAKDYKGFDVSIETFTGAIKSKYHPYVG